MESSELLIRVYLKKCRPQIQAFLQEPERWKHLIEGKYPTHPSRQKLPGGRGLHVAQVLGKALELNQECDEQEVIECALLHDALHAEECPDLTPAQRMAIAATKGKSVYRDWRHTPHYKFVVLILIADMWSAFLNVEDDDSWPPKYLVEPSEIKPGRLLSTFGCAEMEWAAERIVVLAKERGTWAFDIEFDGLDETPSRDGSSNISHNDYMRGGLLMLANHKWMLPGDHNRSVMVSPSFVKRLVEEGHVNGGTVSPHSS